MTPIKYVLKFFFNDKESSKHTCNVNGTFTSPIENLCPDVVQIDTAQ